MNPHPASTTIGMAAAYAIGAAFIALNAAKVIWHLAKPKGQRWT